MKIWLPVVFTGGGSDVSTRFLGQGLRACGHDVVETTLPHIWQFFPQALRHVSMPAGLDAIVSHSWFGGGFARPGVPLVVVERLFTPSAAHREYRSLAQTLFHEGFVRRCVGESYRRAAAVIALSQASRNEILANFPKVEPRVILNAVDLGLFRPPEKPREPLAGRPVRILFAGNLLRRKGIDLLGPIMAALGPGYELRYTSGLRTSDALRDMDGAVPLGRLTIEQMIREYRHADLLLFPSRHEGLPRVVMEAAACGLPAVVSDVSSLPETVEDNVSGRICRSEDIAAFATAIRDITADEARLRKMGVAARRHAEATFCLQRMAREYADLIETVCRT